MVKKSKYTEEFNKKWIKKRDERQNDFKSYTWGYFLIAVLFVLVVIVAILLHMI